MPERAVLPVFDRCDSCSALVGPGYGPLPMSHGEVCCLYRFVRQGQSASYLDELVQKPNGCDGLCENCPSRLKVQQQQQVAGPVHQPPQRSSDAPQGIIVPSGECITASTRTRSQPRAGKRIAPRLRFGYTKFTIEIRPPKFKRKLWFGTYTEAEIDRARDAVNYYLGYNQPFNLPDSPMLFAKIPLKGIKYEDLQSSCDNFIQVGNERKRAYRYFANQVKGAIHSVLMKGKKLSKNKKKCKVQIGAIEMHPKSQKMQPLSKEVNQILNILKTQPSSKDLEIYDPSSFGSTFSTIMPAASASTSSVMPWASCSIPSSNMPCASVSTYSSAEYMVCDLSDAHPAAYIDPSHEANSKFVPLQPSFLPSPERLSYEEDILSQEEVLKLIQWELTPEEQNYFFSPSVVTPLGGGVSSMMEEDGFPPNNLWSSMWP